MDDNTDYATSFCWAVDSAIRSETASNMGESCVHSFASVVDSAIRSSSTDTEADFGTSPVHSFSLVDKALIRSNSGSGADLEASSVHDVASAVDMRSVAESNVTKYDVEGLQLFSLAELVAATNNFSLHNKIGAGSFGVVYRAKLVDGCEVAIKRGETWPKRKTSIMSELAFLSRVHHKHLVGLVGFCEEKHERLLVYEYMKNGSLYDHLHDKGSSMLNSWKMRIKIALDASLGIEYLHNYAVPSTIHSDIKSSNILIDAAWTARVSDFGLSLMRPEPDRDYREMKIVGTAGYIDPEYLTRHVLTEKSDVYAFGVVLLELLTGKRAIFTYNKYRSTLQNVVSFAVAAILAGELVKVLDPKVGLSDVNVAEAVELVAYTAIHCVNLEGKDRPTMADIVVNLERALAICESSHESISSGTISVSE